MLFSIIIGTVAIVYRDEFEGHRIFPTDETPTTDPTTDLPTFPPPTEEPEQPVDRVAEAISFGIACYCSAVFDVSIVLKKLNSTTKVVVGIILV
jgi:hypothetical protein